MLGSRFSESPCLKKVQETRRHNSERHLPSISTLASTCKHIPVPTYLHTCKHISTHPNIHRYTLWRAPKPVWLIMNLSLQPVLQCTPAEDQRWPQEGNRGSHQATPWELKNHWFTVLLLWLPAMFWSGKHNLRLWSQWELFPKWKKAWDSSSSVNPSGKLPSVPCNVLLIVHINLKFPQSPQTSVLL